MSKHENKNINFLEALKKYIEDHEVEIELSENKRGRMALDIGYRHDNGEYIISKWGHTSTFIGMSKNIGFHR